MPIRLALAGEDRRTLDRLTRICSRERDVAVVARYSTSRQTLQKLAQHRPDILVLDLSIRNADALNVLRHSEGKGLPTRCIILIDVEDDSALEALRLGACGVVPMHLAAKLLVSCIRDVHAGTKWLERHFAIRILDKLLDTPFWQLDCGPPI
jgi:DNA-binding NarL/FixJ family response regulator